VGQKTHPLGFRVGITLKHKTFWFSTFKKYSKLVKDDDQIREYFNLLINKASISDIIIHRDNRNKKIEIIIKTARPGILIGKKGEELEKLTINLKKKLPKEQQIRIKIKEIKNPYVNASLLGDFIVEQLEKRIKMKRVITLAMKRVGPTIPGIKIQVSGRLNGDEMARSEWVRKGRLPLHTLRANIDYVLKKAHTIHGILGIKVWLFKDEILNNYIKK
jgi:small subunit ribosomal protein S3